MPRGLQPHQLVTLHTGGNETAHVPCRKCGYNLHGITYHPFFEITTLRCPECGHENRYQVEPGCFRRMPPRERAAARLLALCWAGLLFILLALAVSRTIG